LYINDTNIVLLKIIKKKCFDISSLWNIVCVTIITTVFAWGINVLVVGVVGYLMRNVNWRYVQFMSGSHGIHTIAAYWYVFPIDEKQIEIMELVQERRRP
jgi:hypothetical protein